MKYGPENHIFEIIEECQEELLLERETFWKLHYDVLTVESLCCRIDGKGGRMSKESCERMSIARTGKPKGPFSDEHKNNLKLAKVGYKPTFGFQERTPETVEKNKLSQKFRRDLTI